MTKTPAEIADGLTEAEKRVLLVLRYDFGWPLNDVAEAAGLSLKEARLARLALRDKGIARISQGHDEDSTYLLGSYYYLTRPLGLAVRNELMSRDDG